ncbi:unnamed protein product [Gongylonema pulchrum]|uniref:TYR_PHOSPHATASE_2 domain-containing protein n=1 Tax=Gongylonema pulchrum TaxID=637853 RepID=A0A183CVC5_9BILA|nr:unnamed protein product [Gongylonema pulchrum]
MHYDKWTEEEPITPNTLIRIITSMNSLLNKDSKKPIIVHSTYGTRRAAIYVITALLMQQLAETQKMSVVSAAKAVCKRRYGVLRRREDFKLILETVLQYAKQTDLVKDDQTFHRVMQILEERPQVIPDMNAPSHENY